MVSLSLLLPTPQPTAFEEKAIEKVDDLLESYMGIRDTELGEWGHLDLGMGASLGEGLLGPAGLGVSWVPLPSVLPFRPLPLSSGHHGGARKGQEEPG